MTPRLLVAGVGNIFLADDAFGPEVIRALEPRPLPPGAQVRDYGIRGLDLAYDLLSGYATAVLVDAAPRGHRPGTLSLIEAEPPDGTVPPEAHGMDPAKVLALATHLGDEPLPRVLVLACEPGVLPGDDDLLPGLSAPVREAVDRAVDALHALVPALLADPAGPAALVGPPDGIRDRPLGCAAPYGAPLSRRSVKPRAVPDAAGDPVTAPEEQRPCAGPTSDRPSWPRTTAWPRACATISPGRA